MAAASGTAHEVLWAVWSASGLADAWQAASAAGGSRGAAADADLIGRSPARKIALPRIVRAEHRTLDPGELRRLVNELPDHYQTLVLRAGVLRLAWEEVIALRVRDVDFARETVTVAQTIE